MDNYLEIKKHIEDHEKFILTGDVVNNDDKPYLVVDIIVNYGYNPDYGDDRVCECGHDYYRHFDSYENMDAVGCKYCKCREFKEAK